MWPFVPLKAQVADTHIDKGNCLQMSLQYHISLPNNDLHLLEQISNNTLYRCVCYLCHKWRKWHAYHNGHNSTENTENA